MQSQHTGVHGCDRRNVFPGGAFGEMRFRQRVFNGAFSASDFCPELKYFNFEAIIVQLGLIS